MGEKETQHVDGVNNSILGGYEQSTPVPAARGLVIVFRHRLCAGGLVREEHTKGLLLPSR